MPINSTTSIDYRENDCQAQDAAHVAAFREAIEKQRAADAALVEARREASKARRREAKKASVKANWERRRKTIEAWREANPECVATYAKKYRDGHKEERLAAKRRRYQTNGINCRLKKYGLSIEQFNAMLESQGNRCHCCSTPFGLLKGQRPCIDHCHGTGRIRGLLCNRCNMLLGHAEDSPKILRACACYLERMKRE